MKKLIFSLLLIFSTGLIFAQVKETPKGDSKIKYKEKSNLKTAGVQKKDEVKPEKVESTEPVIIQRLEYNYYDNSNTNSSTNVEAEKKNEVVVPARTIDDDIADVDSKIKAIDTKIEWVKSNKEEDKKAKENGWYEQMDGFKKNYQAQKEELIKLKK